MSDDELTAPCLHRQFKAVVEVNRLVDDHTALSFHADVRVNCVECGCAFRWLGLQPGFNMKGAAVSFDGTEARIALVPIE